MQKLQLYISNERIDLFKDEQVSFNQSIQNIKDPAKIFTEFTQTFTVPASKTNNQIFKHYYNFNNVNPNNLRFSAFDARSKVDANIELNNVAFKQGYIRLDGVDLKLNKPYAYRITFFGETVNIKDILKEDKLGVLSDLNQFNLTYDATNIKAKLQNTTNAILCPLITAGASHGEPPENFSRLYYNSQTHGTNNGNLYWHQGGGTNSNGVYWEDLKYAIRLYEIIEAITASYPSLVFTDDFFSTSNAEFYNLHMWLHRKKGLVEPATQVTTFPTLVTGFPSSGAGSKTTVVDGSGLIINSGYLPNVLQQLTIETTSSEPYDVIINRNGTVWASLTQQTGDNTYDPADIGFMDAAVYNIIIRVSANIQFSKIEWELAGFADGSVWGSETYDTGTFDAEADVEFIITEQIPDMKIIDFLTAIFKMFNLTAFYVSNRQDADFGKIKVQKLDDFYSAGTSYDISEYVDTKTNQVNVALPYREINFSYEGTGTLLALQYQQLQNKVWGSEGFTGNATVGNNFDAPNPIYKVTIPFEHLQYERLVNADTTLSAPNNETTIQYGYFVDDNYEPYFGKPLIFYPIRQTGTGTTPISFQDDLSGTHSKLTSYYIPSNSLSIDPTTSTKNLNFYLEINEYTLDTNFTGTLFEENYLEYIQDIFNSKRRLTKLKAYLPLKIIYNLNMNDRVVINNQSYNINNLTTNLITGESNMELLNNNYIGNVSGNFRVLTDVYQTYPNYSNYYYESQIGAAQNLEVGDVIYTNQALTTTLTADTYYQVGSSETTTRCTDSSYLMTMTVNSSGVITNILCGQP
jgi:hypothetical protein